MAGSLGLTSSNGMAMAKDMPKNNESPSTQQTEGAKLGDSLTANSKVQKGKRNLVAGVLGPALKLWLRSQVEAVERLEVAIGSETGEGDHLTSRQMLAGRIPLVRVEADEVIYKGLHLGQLQLAGRDIRMNLGQAVRGKPLKLMAPIAVDLQLKMTEAQLNESLESPLLAPQLVEWLTLLQALLMEGEPIGAAPLTQPRIALAGGELGVGLDIEHLGLRVYQGEPSAAAELAIETGLTIANGNLLKLRQPCWSEAPPAGFKDDLSGLAMMSLKLGSDVVIERIAIAAGQLQLTGQLTVQP